MGFIGVNALMRAVSFSAGDWFFLIGSLRAGIEYGALISVYIEAPCYFLFSFWEVVSIEPDGTFSELRLS